MSITPADITAWIPIARTIVAFFDSLRRTENRAPTPEELAEAIAGYEAARNRVARAEDAHEAKHG